MDNFLFAELEKPLSSFDGMAAGSFTDMRGKKVTFNPDMLEKYIDNTREVIESTRTDKGELVGLPIDMDGHDHKGGAGWITGVSKDATRDILKFDVNWTDAGRQLIESNTRRFFSPTVDPGNKVVLGGSLTNWPATRDTLGRMMLRPIELSQNLQELDMQENLIQSDLLKNLLELGKDFLAELKGKKAVTPDPEPKQENDMPELTLTEFMQTAEANAELERRATERASELLQAEQLKSKVLDFAKSITGDKPVALAMKADDLAAAILALPETDKVIELLSKVYEAKVLEFSEKGHAGEQHNKQAVPAEIKPYIVKFIEAGKTAADFFTANPELGAADDYELSEFNKEK
jgi:hypothetical protein